MSFGVVCDPSFSDALCEGNGRFAVKQPPLSRIPSETYDSKLLLSLGEHKRGLISFIAKLVWSRGCSRTWRVCGGATQQYYDSFRRHAWGSDRHGFVALCQQRVSARLAHLLRIRLREPRLVGRRQQRIRIHRRAQGRPVGSAWRDVRLWLCLKVNFSGLCVQVNSVSYP